MLNFKRWNTFSIEDFDIYIKFCEYEYMKKQLVLILIAFSSYTFSISEEAMEMCSSFKETEGYNNNNKGSGAQGVPEQESSTSALVLTGGVKRTHNKCVLGKELQAQR